MQNVQNTNVLANEGSTTTWARLMALEELVGTRRLEFTAFKNRRERLNRLRNAPATSHVMIIIPAIDIILRAPCRTYTVSLFPGDTRNIVVVKSHYIGDGTWAYVRMTRKVE